MRDSKQEIKDSKYLISHIQSQYTRFSKGQKLIAQYILKNYDKVAFMTACKLGETVGVSESTVVRFANALGYSGYPKLFTRNLLYTAMTRAKKMLIVVGSKKIINYMVDNVDSKNRKTGLKEKILKVIGT